MNERPRFIRLELFLSIGLASFGCAAAEAPGLDTEELRRCGSSRHPCADLASVPDLAAASDLGTTPHDLGSASGAPTIAGCTVFPADNAWNQDISALPVHASSAAYIGIIGTTTAFHPDFSSTAYDPPYGYGIPVTVVDASLPKVPITFVSYPSEADPGPYPIPDSVAIEGGPSSTGDRHGIILESGSCTVYEVLGLAHTASGWQGDVGAVWKLGVDSTRPANWTSADAAGLPVLPGLVRYDEVAAGEIKHALRFTVQHSQKAFIAPASHFASSSTNSAYPPMGLRVRLKASVDITKFPPRMQVIVRALQRYGMLVADNGSNWYLTGSPDSRWDDDELNTLKQLHGSDFEAVETGSLAY